MFTRRRGFRTYLRERVLVTTKGGVTSRGILAGEYRDCIVLEHVEEIASGTDGKPVVLPVEGVRIVLLANIETADVTGAGSA